VPLAVCPGGCCSGQWRLPLQPKAHQGCTEGQARRPWTRHARGTLAVAAADLQSGQGQAMVRGVDPWGIPTQAQLIVVRRLATANRKVIVKVVKKVVVRRAGYRGPPTPDPMASPLPPPSALPSPAPRPLPRGKRRK